MSRQIGALRRDVSSLSRSARRHGSHLGHDAADLGDHLWQGGEMVARALGRQARHAGRAVRDDPVPAVVAVAGFALFLNLVLGRRQSSTRR